MVAALRSQTDPKLVLLTSPSTTDAIESKLIISLLVEQHGQTVFRVPVTVQTFEPISLYDEPVTWEDAEWQ
ncbi:MAG: hypothetical protein ACJ789_03615 [Thermomicrobiales bacterium]